MTLTHIIFIVFAAITLLSGLFCVTTRNMFHAALYLVISLFGVAAMFAMLEASFLAAAQLDRVCGRGRHSDHLRRDVDARRGGIAAGQAPVQHAGRAGGRGHGGDAVHPAARGAVLQLSRAGGGRAGRYCRRSWGMALVGDFVLPFEVASVLLLAALIGAIYIARERRKGEVEEG